MQSQRVVLLLGLAVTAAACTTTTFQSTWRNPETKPIVLEGQKVVAFVITAQETTRRAAEDTVAQQLSARGAQGISAWSILPTADVRDEEKARAAFAKTGAVAVVTMEVVATDRQSGSTSFGMSVRSSSHRSFWGNYRWASQMVWGGQPAASANVSVETLLYTLEPDELIWAGRSRTVRPNDISVVFGEVANATAREMERAGLLKRPTH